MTLAAKKKESSRQLAGHDGYELKLLSYCCKWIKGKFYDFGSIDFSFIYEK